MPRTRPSKTQIALLARGVASDVARRLSEDGHTLAALKLRSESDLVELGLTDTQARKVRSESRPPIPQAVVVRLLAESAATCCKCQRVGTPIVIHHIVSWHVSHSNDEENLVVVCPNCHAEAHTRSDIALELTPERLRGLKESWKAVVVRRQSEAIAERIDTDGAHSDFINVPRLFELAQLTGATASQQAAFRNLRRAGVVDDDGLVKPPRYWSDEELRFIGDSHHNVALTLYLGSMLRSVVSRINVIDLAEIWSVREMRSIVRPGQYVLTSGGHYFKSVGPQPRGRGQRRRITRQGHGVTLTGEFDPWYSLTSSAYQVHLTGHTSCSAIWMIRTIESVGDQLELTGSCLSIGPAVHEGPVRPTIAWIRESEEAEDAETEGDDVEGTLAESGEAGDSDARMDFCAH